MGSLTMAGLAVIIIVVLWLRGGVGRVGLVLAILAGAALGGLDPIADTAYQAAAAVGEVAVQIGAYAEQPDWGTEGAKG